MTITLEEANEKLIAMIDRHACDEGAFIEVKKDIWYVMTPEHSEECTELSPVSYTHLTLPTIYSV